MIGDSGLGAYFVESEPVAHATLAHTSATTPVTSAAPRRNAEREPTRISTHAGPTAMPNSACSVGRVPRGRNQQNNPNQRGVPAIISAANPDDTFCSAQFTPPLPTPNISADAKTA